MPKWIYYVEGECEQSFLKAFMYSKNNLFKPGKVEVYNFNNKKITKGFAYAVKSDTNFVIVIDTDKDDASVLDENIAMLLKHSCLKKSSIYIVLSIKNFEDEILYACSKLNNIHEMFNTNSVSDFKKKFIKQQNLEAKLIGLGFDIYKMWSRKPEHPFEKFENEGYKIKEKISRKHV